MNQKLLVRIGGTDAPGITAALTKYLAENSGKILDIEQVVTHDLLNLILLVEFDHDRSVDAVITDMKARLSSFQLDTQITSVDGNYEIADPAHRFVATVIADEIPTQFLSDLTAVLADAATNIDGIRKLNSGGLSSIELIASSKEKINLPNIKEKLLGVSARYPGVDLAVQRENLYRRSKRLVVFDMDSTLIQGEIIDELAALAGKHAEVADLTRRAMEGEMDFQESLLRRAGMLKGLTTSDLEKVANSIKLNPGVDSLMRVLKKLGFKTAIISGGFTYFTDRLKNDLGFHYAYSNSLEIEDGELTGRLTGLIVDGRRKADLLDFIAQQEGVILDQVIAIGDGANDLQMLKKAGLGIAFNAKVFTKKAIGTSITKKSMDSILYFLGITDNDLRDMGITSSH